jgi:hypothetical protein
LDLADPNRLDWHAEDETGGDVGAAGDRCQMDILLDAVIDEAKTFRR